MKIIYDLMGLAAKLPEIVSVLVCPVLLLIVGLLFAIFGLRRGYLPLTVALGGAGLFLVGAHDMTAGFAYLGLYIVWSALVSLLFLIPLRRKKRSDAQQELYEKFHLELDIPEERPASRSEALYGREESGLRLAHTAGLLEKLKKSDLSASDRLEADALSYTLESLGDKELTAEEMRTLNDCLATILKLTAKYKL